MMEWLRKIRDTIEHKIKITVYKWCIAILRKLRIHHTTDLITKANGKSGVEWNDLLLIGLKHQSGDYYYVMYYKPGVAFGQSIVHIDDLITGKANLALRTSSAYDIPTAVQVAVDNERHGVFSGGVITRVGELELGPSEEKYEPLYRDHAEHEALKAEIKLEYTAKLDELIRVRNEG